MIEMVVKEDSCVCCGRAVPEGTQVCYNCGLTSVINTPSQKIPTLDTSRSIFNETFEKVKEIIKVMDGLSEEGFKNNYFNDPHFNRGFDLLVHTFLKGD